MSNSRLIIAGTGGFGRELLCWAGDCADAGLLPRVSGVISDQPDSLAGYSYDVPQIGNVTEFDVRPGDAFLLAIGDPAGKRKVAELLAARGACFASLVHPTATVARTATLGEGAILCPHSLVSADCLLGRFVTVNALSSIGHDVQVGDFTTLSAHVDVTGWCVVGDEVMIGSGAKVLPKVRIEQRATIGAGSTVYRTVKEGTTVYAPAAKTMSRTV